MQRYVEAVDGRRLLCFDQRFVQPAGRGVGENLGKDIDGSEIRMRPRRHVIPDADELSVSDSFDARGAFAVLSRLDGVDRLKCAGGSRDRPKVVRDELQRFCGIKLACDQQHRVIGLIVFVIESLQSWDRNVFDVTARANRQVRVIVPIVGRRKYALEHDQSGLVLARFILVANDGHLGVEVFFGDK